MGHLFLFNHPAMKRRFQKGIHDDFSFNTLYIVLWCQGRPFITKIFTNTSLVNPGDAKGDRSNLWIIFPLHCKSKELRGYPITALKVCKETLAILLSLNDGPTMAWCWPILCWLGLNWMFTGHTSTRQSFYQGLWDNLSPGPMAWWIVFKYDFKTRTWQSERKHG